MFILMKCTYIIKQKSTHATWHVEPDAFLLNPTIFRIHPAIQLLLGFFALQKKKQDLRTSSFLPQFFEFPAIFLTNALSFTIQLHRFFAQRYLDLFEAFYFTDSIHHGIHHHEFHHHLGCHMFGSLFPSIEESQIPSLSD